MDVSRRNSSADGMQLPIKIEAESKLHYEALGEGKMRIGNKTCTVKQGGVPLSKIQVEQLADLFNNTLADVKIGRSEVWRVSPDSVQVFNRNDIGKPEAKATNTLKFKDEAAYKEQVANFVKTAGTTDEVAQEKFREALGGAAATDKAQNVLSPSLTTSQPKVKPESVNLDEGAAASPATSASASAPAAAALPAPINPMPPGAKPVTLPPTVAPPPRPSTAAASPTAASSATSAPPSGLPVEPAPLPGTTSGAKATRPTRAPPPPPPPAASSAPSGSATVTPALPKATARAEEAEKHAFFKVGDDRPPPPPGLYPSTDAASLAKEQVATADHAQQLKEEAEKQDPFIVGDERPAPPPDFNDQPSSQPTPTGGLPTEKQTADASDITTVLPAAGESETVFKEFDTIIDTKLKEAEEAVNQSPTAAEPKQVQQEKEPVAVNQPPTAEQLEQLAQVQQEKDLKEFLESDFPLPPPLADDDTLDLE